MKCDIVFTPETLQEDLILKRMKVNNELISDIPDAVQQLVYDSFMECLDESNFDLSCETQVKELERR